MQICSSKKKLKCFMNHFRKLYVLLWTADSDGNCFWKKKLKDKHPCLKYYNNIILCNCVQTSILPNTVAGGY